MINLLRDKELWSKIQNSHEYQPLRKMLTDGYNDCCKGKEIPLIKFSDEMDFFRTGNRNRFQSLYFLRRKQLTIYAMMSVIHPENTEYIGKLEDVICEICNEYSWVLPAHRSPLWLNKRDGIDLFAAETGLYLAEIKQMLIHRLNPVVIERITAEINTRILNCFENEQMLFEKLTSNWAAVCGGSVGITFIYESPQRYSKIEHRIERCMTNYLMGISDDGSTSEGASYWNYGFSFYVMYNDVKRRYTMGKSDAFTNEKVKKLAGFFTAILLDKDNIVSFSDSSLTYTYNIGLLHFLKKEYDIEMPPADKAALVFSRFSETLRSFLYYRPDFFLSGNLDSREEFFSVLQWYVKRGDKYSFAVKGGHNEEQHNHNDIGSFIIVNNKKQMLCDLGNPVYTAETFSSKRYNILNNSSLGHSVPIINGCAQANGKQYFGTLSMASGKICIDMKNAYPCEVKNLSRTFELSDNQIILSDCFDDDIDIVERLVTETEPTIYENSVVIDKTTICFDKAWSASYKTETIMKHDGVTQRTVFLIDFKNNEKCKEFNLQITFQ